MHNWRRFQIPLIVGLAVLFAFSLISINLKHPHPSRPLEAGIIGLTAPVLNGVSQVGDGFERVWKGYLYLIGAQQENERLKKEIAEFKQKEIQYQEAKLAIERLERLFNLKTQLAAPITAARVIGYDTSVWYKCVLIDKGEAQGIRWGMPVVNADGVVGRVIESYGSYAKVMLVIDRNCAVDALVQRNRQRGILEGIGSSHARLRYVLKNSEVQVDDVVLTSGLEGIFPPGMVLGKVVAVDKKTLGIFQEIEIKPAVDLASLEEVLVVSTSIPVWKK